jgi:hypothetical protein
MGEGMTNTNKPEQGLSGLDDKKRETLIKLGIGAAFVVPVVASLSLNELTISKAHAKMANGSGVHNDHNDHKEGNVGTPS